MKVNWSSKPSPIWWPVHYTKPKDGGGEDVFEFRAKIDPAPRSEMARYYAQELTDDDLIRAHVHDWDGPEDDNGKVPCTAENVEAMLDQDMEVSRGLARAVIEVSDGGVRKNSRTSPG